MVCLLLSHPCNYMILQYCGIVNTFLQSFLIFFRGW
nr:MAG TPA: hypothetical protein [Caudoviricetes sp.]